MTAVAADFAGGVITPNIGRSFRFIASGADRVNYLPILSPKCVAMRRTGTFLLTSEKNRIAARRDPLYRPPKASSMKMTLFARSATFPNPYPAAACQRRRDDPQYVPATDCVRSRASLCPGVPGEPLHRHARRMSGDLHRGLEARWQKDHLGRRECRRNLATKRQYESRLRHDGLPRQPIHVGRM